MTPAQVIVAGLALAPVALVAMPWFVWIVAVYAALLGGI